jgi:putative hydrolase of the HAD superfamily
VTNHRVNPKIIEKTIQYGKDLLDKPIELLEDVELVLKTFYGHYKLVVATKGDLLDQERKLMKSGLANYFHHIEIMSDKKEKDYLKLLKHLDCQPENFLMIGNSLKSDVLPVLEIGGYAVHIPYHTTWAHEVINHEIDHHNFLKIKYLREIINILN